MQNESFFFFCVILLRSLLFLYNFAAFYGICLSFLSCLLLLSCLGIINITK